VSGSASVALVCCDLAGTIVSDGSVLEKAFAEAIATQGVVPGTAAYARSMVVVDRSSGLPPRDVMHTLFADDEAQAQAAYLSFERSYRAVAERFGLTTVPGVQDALARLSSADLKVCVISGFSRPTSRLVLERTGISRNADLTLCLDDAPRGFPWPDLVLTAVMRLGIDDVASVAVAGDSENVITAGRRAGAQTLIGIPGERPARRLRAAGATHLINSIAELPAALL
jgi:phosphoglycolate phosphatase